MARRDRWPGRILLPALAAGVLAAVSPAANAGDDAPAARPAPPQPDVHDVRVLRQWMRQADAKGRARDAAGVRALLEPVIAAPAFVQLTARERAGVLRVALNVSAALGDFQAAWAHSRRLTAMAEATAGDWRSRQNLAWRLKDTPDQALALRTIVERWPEQLAQIEDVAIASLFETAEPEVRRPLAEALLTANWTQKQTIYDQVSGVWRIYALDLVRRGEIARAAEVSRRIVDPYRILNMRADRRFDPLTTAHPDQFDLDRAIERELTLYAERATAAPGSLDAQAAYAVRLMQRNRLDEALAVVDAGLARKPPRRRPAAASARQDDVNWALNVRARVLIAMGRDEEAIDALQRAIERPEQGVVNVSQTLNLGNELNHMARPKEALGVVSEITRGQVSDHGWAVLTQVQACAHAQLGDREAAAKAVAELRRENPGFNGAVEFALLCANDLDAVAAHYVEGAEKGRASALELIQDYAWLEGRGAFRREIAERRKRVLARPEVKAVIEKFGRRLRVNLMED